MFKRILVSFFLFALMLSLSACGPNPPRQNVDEGIAVDAIDGSIISHKMDDPDAAAYWTQAEIASQGGKYEEASAYIENALRIIPDDAILWSRLAEFRMKLGEHVLAENYAAKSNVLAKDNKVMQYRNWLIIQYVRDKRGDVLGAREAQVEVRKYAPD